MIWLLLIPAAIIAFFLYSIWSVWGLERYYYEKLFGKEFGQFKDVVTTDQKAYIIGTKEFKKWKIERVKKWLGL